MFGPGRKDRELRRVDRLAIDAQSVSYHSEPSTAVSGTVGKCPAPLNRQHHVIAAFSVLLA